MIETLDGKWWFKALSRLWRPLQSWGFGSAAVFYAWRGALGYEFDVETFGALAAVSLGGFLGRGAEKAADTRNVAKYAPGNLDEPDWSKGD